LGETLKGAIEITKGIWFGGDFETLKNMIEESLNENFVDENMGLK
jgi:hypothetical protein